MRPAETRQRTIDLPDLLSAVEEATEGYERWLDRLDADQGCEPGTRDGWKAIGVPAYWVAEVLANGQTRHDALMAYFASVGIKDLGDLVGQGWEVYCRYRDGFEWDWAAAPAIEHKTVGALVRARRQGLVARNEVNGNSGWVVTAEGDELVAVDEATD